MKRLFLSLVMLTVIGMSSAFAQITVTDSASVNPICQGSSTTLTAFGATSYLWSTGSTINPLVVAPTVATTYTVTGTSVLGTGTASITVYVNGAPVVSVTASVNPILLGNSTTLTAAGASTYLWSTGSTINPITVTPAITTVYTVTGTSFGCTGAGSITVYVNAVVSASITSSTNVSCNGGSDGTATVTATGSYSPFNYQWNTTPVQTTPTATGLSAGTYTVTVTDAMANTATATVVITQPTALVVSIVSSTSVSCYGSSDGTATASATGSTPPYSFLWSNYQTAITAVGLSAGTYTVTATDINGCTNTASVVIGQPTAVGAHIISYTNATCYGINNGSAIVIDSGGIPPFNYQWNTLPHQLSPNATGLPAGTYTVIMTDANGCTSTASVVITQPAAGIVSIVSTTNASCIGSSNGNITAIATSGTSPYTYLWNTTPPQTTATATGLSAGTYSVSATDSNGCISLANCTIFSNDSTLSYFTIYPDTAILHHYFIVNDASGGVLPYTYYWSWGDGTHDTIAYPSHTYAASGFYNICLTVTDFSGCSNTYCDSTYLLKSSSSMVSVTVISPTTGIIEDGLSNQIKIYPNPANDNLTIDVSATLNLPAIIEISNIQGQVIKQQTTNVETTNFVVSALAKGMYFVKVKTETGVAVKKFIKE